MRVTTIIALVGLAVGCASEEPVIDTIPPQGAGMPTTSLTLPADAGGTDALQIHDLEGVTVELIGVDTGPGEMLQIRWRFRNDSPEERLLAAGLDRTDDNYPLTADAFLIDATHQKKYLVVVDENDLPVASRHGGPGPVSIGPGEQIDAWAKFPAPSTDTTRVTVHVPGAPPFEDVRVPVSQD